MATHIKTIIVGKNADVHPSEMRQCTRCINNSTTSVIV